MGSIAEFSHLVLEMFALYSGAIFGDTTIPIQQDMNHVCSTPRSYNRGEEHQAEDHGPLPTLCPGAEATGMQQRRLQLNIEGFTLWQQRNDRELRGDGASGAWTHTNEQIPPGIGLGAI